MLMPRVFKNNFMDDFFSYPFKEFNFENTGMMKTDIKEADKGYDITIDMPGCKKEDVKAELNDGYLTIQAESNYDNDEKDDNGRYIRRERYSGSCSRSFYVGDQIKEEDIQAKFENGTLKLFVPKLEETPAIEQKKYIAIE